MATDQPWWDLGTVLAGKLRKLGERYGVPESVNFESHYFKSNAPLLIAILQLDTIEAQTRTTRNLLWVSVGLALLSAALLAVSVVTLIH
jgi:hypothetical protein